MSIFNSYGPCRGITLFKWGQWRAEIWIIPSYYKIIEHSHPSEDVELVHIFGRSVFYRRNMKTGMMESVEVPPWSKLRKFTVRSFHTHWFDTCKTPMIFLNIQHFLPGHKPKSAADDFAISIYAERH